MIEYLSPSSLDVWNTDQEEFFLKYLAVEKPPRLPQNKPMSVGSAFDAYIKADILAGIFGQSDMFDGLFQEQVEPQNRDFALIAGATCYDAYKSSGAHTELYKILRAATDVNVEGDVTRNVRGVPIRGKPDLSCRLNGYKVILDWKVNGYCSKTTKTPTPGYVKILGSKRHGQCHKDAHLWDVGPITYNLNGMDASWLKQLVTYSWLVNGDGETIGCIDQLCCHPISVALHRAVLTEGGLFDEYAKCWEVIHSDHIFRNKTFEESKERCAILSQQGLIYDNSPEGEWLKSIRGL